MKDNIASRKVQSNYNKTQGMISKFKWSTREVQANYLTITYAWCLFLDFALVNLNVESAMYSVGYYEVTIDYQICFEIILS